MQDLTGKTPGSQLTAAEWNELPQEVQNAITTAGFALSGGDLSQLVKAIATYVASGQYYTDSGGANSYTLANIGSLESPQSYTNGLRVLFIANATNTGASVCEVTGATGGAQPIFDTNGAALTGGEITAGQPVELFYDTGVAGFKLYSLAVADTRLNVNNGEGSAAFSVNSTNHNDYINCTNAGAITVTVQAPTAPYGDVINFERDLAAGVVTMSPDGGVSIVTKAGNTLSLDVAGEVGTLVSKAANLWKWVK